MGIETAIIAAAISAAGALGAAGVNAISSNNAAKKQAAAAKEANKQPSALDLANQREKERVRAMGSSSLLGGNKSILGGSDDSQPASSRSSLLGGN